MRQLGFALAFILLNSAVWGATFFEDDFESYFDDTELTDEGDLYMSITIPSLIVATFGGGTGLATQNECLELLGCVGRDKVRKLTEIIAGVVLAGEISLGAAISSLDWVSSHEQYGRNR